MKKIQFKDCPHFPCTKSEEQSCKHCFCCMYPCRIPQTGGKYITTKTGHMLWDCSECTAIHDQKVVELLNLDKNETNEKILNVAKSKLLIYLIENMDLDYLIDKQEVEELNV